MLLIFSKMTKNHQDKKHEHQEQHDEKKSTTPQHDQAELDLKILDLEQKNHQLLLALADSKNEYNMLLKKTQERVDFAVSGFASDLVEILEVFFIATSSVVDEHMHDNPHFKSFFEGIDLTKKQITQMLEKHKVKRIFPQKEQFDRNLHQAVSSVPSVEPEGVIISVLQTGYTLNDRVLKPALVVVSNGTQPQ